MSGVQVSFLGEYHEQKHVVCRVREIVSPVRYDQQNLGKF